MMIQKSLKAIERMEVTSHVKGFFDNKNNSYIHTAQNARITSTRNMRKR